MTPQHLRLAAANWRAVHEAVHGPLDTQTSETVNEALSFVITCAQVELVADRKETRVSLGTGAGH